MSRIVGFERRFFIGGSDARIIMGNDEAALVRLWREKRGEAEPEDLSGNLIVQLGRATEEVNRSWYERNTGRQVRDVQRRVRHSAIPWMAATLDGIVEGTEAVFEAKFMLPWSFSEEAAAEKYMAQVQHNMWVTHMLCWTCAMYFSAAASSENDQGSMNLASNTASVPSTIPSRVAAIQGIAECLTRRCTSRTCWPVLRSYQERLSSSVALPSCTMRLPDRSSGTPELRRTAAK